MTTGRSKSWRNSAEATRPQPSVPKLCPPWKGHLQAGSFPIPRARSSLSPGTAPGFWESQLLLEPGCAQAPAPQLGVFLPARARVCASTSLRACSPPFSPGPHLSSLSPRFGFYKYMKMDEEEEDPRQRAFLFLNADSESPLPAGGFRASLSSLARGSAPATLSRQPSRRGMRLGGAPPVMPGGLQEGRAARSGLPPCRPARSVVTHPARLGHKALRGVGSGMLGLGFAFPAA